MTQRELEKLPAGSFVVHQRYGLCRFRLEYGLGGGGALFGIILTPVGSAGRFHLQQDTKTTIPDVMIPTGRVLKPFLSTKKEATHADADRS